MRFRMGSVFWNSDKMRETNVKHQLEHCIYNFGGKTKITKMEQHSSLKGAVNQFGRWLREIAVLFVCDDLWGLSRSGFGYLPHLKRLLRDAPRNKQLISKWDKKIAEEFSLKCQTFGTLSTRGHGSLNLSSEVAFGDEQIEM